MGCTVWDVLTSVMQFDGSPTAHKDTIRILGGRGHRVRESDAWCTEQLMAIMYQADGIDLIGGYASSSGKLMEHAKKLGIWKSGTSGILPFEPVIFGRSGESNHTELAIGASLDVSGNYKGGTSRRLRSSHSSKLMGHISPRYDPMPDMDNVQISVIAAYTMLGLYGSGKTRERCLSVFGEANAKKIQRLIDEVWDSTDKTARVMAIACIAGYMSKKDYRESILHSWSSAVQAEINAIHSHKGKALESVADEVISGYYGDNAVRKLLLDFCGYDPKDVQDEVNKLLREPQKASEDHARASITFLYRGKPRKTKDVDGLQGDSWVIKMGDHALIGDTMLSGGLDKILAEIEGIEHVHLYISHPHGDHMGQNANKLIKSGRIEVCYLPSEYTIASQYKKRYQTLVKDCEKMGVDVKVLKILSVIECGDIRGKVLYQQIEKTTDSVNMRSLITIFTFAGKTFLSCGDHHTGEKESKFKYSKHVDIHILAHHGLFTGSTFSFLESISPDWIIHSGWASYPNGSVSQDAKVKRAQNNSQKFGNLLIGDVNGRIELVIEGGVITAHGERNMVGKSIKYVLGGKTYTKIVHVCSKTKLVPVKSMIPAGARII